MSSRLRAYYKVYFTPLASSETYGSERDVTDNITIDGLPNVRQSIDSNDYDIGIFTFGNIDLTGYNINGIFNDENDSRSIFPAGRDRCLVRIEFTQIDETNGLETGTITFRGIIEERATRLTSIKTNKIKFKVLSRDSIFNTVVVAGGTVANGTSVKDAIFQVLNKPRITQILTIDEANISPDLNVTIDNGDALSERKTKDVLEELLLISNSVLLVNDSDEVIVRSREENASSDIIDLFGQYDIRGRENIIDITAYNTGKHRQFTVIRVNDTEVRNAALAGDFGDNVKAIEVDSISNVDTQNQIANRLLSEFSAVKIELSVKVETPLVMNAKLLDRVKINYPFRLTPFESDFFPTIGTTKIGETGFRLPNVQGSIKIDDNLKFKVIEINENASSFTTILKLRQAGTTLSDGVFSEGTSNVVGAGVIGTAVIG